MPSEAGTPESSAQVDADRWRIPGLGVRIHGEMETLVGAPNVVKTERPECFTICLLRRCFNTRLYVVSTRACCDPRPAWTGLNWGASGNMVTSCS